MGGDMLAMLNAYERGRLLAMMERDIAAVTGVRRVHFTRFLWPQMSDLEADTFINAVLQEFA